MEVTQATSGCSQRKERSNSSASTTENSVPSIRKLLPKSSETPPRNAMTSRPASFSKWARMQEVVVFPWVPATARQRVAALIMPSTSARFLTAKPSWRK